MSNLTLHCEGCMGEFGFDDLSDDCYCDNCEYALCEMLSARDNELAKELDCE